MDGTNSRAAPERTILSLSITVEDKRKLKIMAAERNTTIAAIIHGWVKEHCSDKSEESTN